MGNVGCAVTGRPQEGPGSPDGSLISTFPHSPSPPSAGRRCFSNRKLFADNGPPPDVLGGLSARRCPPCGTLEAPGAVSLRGCQDTPAWCVPQVGRCVAGRWGQDGWEPAAEAGVGMEGPEGAEAGAGCRGPRSWVGSAQGSGTRIPRLSGSVADPQRGSHLVTCQALLSSYTFRGAKHFLPIPSQGASGCKPPRS